MKRTVFVVACVAASVAYAVMPAGAIVGGQLDGNLHPHVGTLVGDLPPFAFGIPFCTGTLISPTVVLTAAHCDLSPNGGTLLGVSFAPQYTAGDPVLTGTFHANPDFDQAQGHPADIGVVVLDTAVTGVTPASLPALGSLEGSLTQSSVFTAVGYGDFAGLPDPQTPPFPNDGYRRYAVSSFNSLGPAYLRLSQNASHGDGGTCNGDSGGPNFIGAGPTETNVIASITITGDTRCKSTNVGYRLDLPEAQSFLAPFLS